MIWQDWCGCRVNGGPLGAHWLLLWLKSDPENAILVMCKTACPMFDKVAIEGELGVPIAVLVRLVLSATRKPNEAPPFPLKSTV